MDEETRKQRIATARQLIDYAASLSHAGDLGGAQRRLDEASGVLESLGDDEDPARLGVAASVHEGKGQIALSAARLDEAYLQLTQAVDLRRREERALDTPRPLHLAIAYINLSAASSRLGRVDEALVDNQRGLDALDRLGDDPTASFMRLATLQARGGLLSAVGRGDDALACYDRAIAVGDALLTADVDEVPELLTQVKIGAAVARHELGRHHEARELGAEAAAEAWDRFDVTGDERALSQYLTAQMNLMTFCERTGAFAAAEDALFRVLKLVGPEPQVVAHGRAFYQRLLSLDDTTLDAGNLPRDEVEESLAELDALAPTAAPE